MFQNMDYDKWSTSFGPKTAGSWNLHCGLPADMDFFIFLSSSSGIIGNRGQSHYAAGNCFQDALARYRTSRLGRHSVSLDVGLVLEAGMVAENEKLLDMMRAAGFFGIRLRDFLFLVEHAMAADPRCADEGIQLPAQVIAAVGTGGLTIQNTPSDPFWTRMAMFRYLNTVDAPPTAAGLGDGAATANVRTAMLEEADSAAAAGASNVDAAANHFCTALMATLARCKGMVPSEIERDRTFEAYGIDSMDATNLRNWISRETNVTVQTLEGQTIWELSLGVAEKVVADEQDDGVAEEVVADKQDGEDPAT